MPLDTTEQEASFFLPPLASSLVKKPQERLDECKVCRCSKDSHWWAKQLGHTFGKEDQGRSCWDIKFLLRVRRTNSCRGGCQQQEENTARAKMAELSPKMRRFLATTRSFHTRVHSLEGSTVAVSSSTYAKAEERMLCKYFGHLENSVFVCLFVF